MNKSESKYFNTALCMDEALITLLEVKDLEYITVKEICEKAGVNRSTFYLHYESIDDLVNETMGIIDKCFLAYFTHSENNFAAKINGKKLEDLVLVTQDYLIPYLQFICENKKVYRASLRNPNGMQTNARYKDLKKYIIEPILQKFEVSEMYWQYYIAYYIEGIVAIIKEWLRNDCQDSVETIAAIIEECVRPSNGVSVRSYIL